MQKIIVTYLASLILFQGVFTNSGILFEINELAENYQLHQSEYGDNLSTFISKHFGDLKESHKEQHQEEQKQHNHPTQDKIGGLSQIDYTFNQTYLILENPIKVNKSLTNYHYLDLFSTFEKQKIFQPPQQT